jgi:hypothetical protein
MELYSRHSDASSSGEEEDVHEGETDEDNITVSVMPEDRESPLLDTGICIADELDTMKKERDALQKEGEQLREQCKHAWELKKIADNISRDINILLLEAEHEEEITQNIMQERDALRLEAEELRAKCKDSDEMEKQLNSVIQNCIDITKERDDLLLEGRTEAADKETINKAREALKIETQNLHAQLKTSALMRDKLNVACDDITKERDSYKSKCRRSEADCEDIRKVMKDLKFEREELEAQFNKYNLLKQQLNTVKVQCDDITKERDAFELRSLSSEKNNKATKMIIEILKVKREELRAQFEDYALLEKRLNTVRQQRDDVKKERNGFILKTQRRAESRGSIMIERDALKLEIRNLRAKIKDADFLEKQLDAAKLLCDNMKRERDFYKLKVRRTAGKREATRKDMHSLKLVA